MSESAPCIAAYLNALQSSDFSSRRLGKLLGNPERNQANIIPDIYLEPSEGWTADAQAAAKAMMVSYLQGIAALTLEPRTLNDVLAPENPDGLAAYQVILANDPDVSAAFNALLDGLRSRDALELIKGPVRAGKSTLDVLRTTGHSNHEARYFEMLDRQQRRRLPERSDDRRYDRHQANVLERRYLGSTRSEREQ